MSEDPKALLAEIERLKARLEEMEADQRAQVESGAIADGESASAVGEKGVMANDVGGDLLAADAIKFQGNIYFGPPTEDPEQALRIYNQVLVKATASLPMRGVDIGASDPTMAQKAVGLANVYVDLDTTAKYVKLDLLEDDPSAGKFRLVPHESGESVQYPYWTLQPKIVE